MAWTKKANLKGTPGTTTHAGLTDVTPDQHHAKYTDVEAVTAMGAEDDGNALRHRRFTAVEVLQALGARENGNPAYHNRYEDDEAAGRIDRDHLYVKVAGDTMTDDLIMKGGAGRGVHFHSSPSAAHVYFIRFAGTDTVDYGLQLGRGTETYLTIKDGAVYVALHTVDAAITARNIIIGATAPSGGGGGTVPNGTLWVETNYGLRRWSGGTTGAWTSIIGGVAIGWKTLPDPAKGMIGDLFVVWAGVNIGLYAKTHVDRWTKVGAP